MPKKAKLPPLAPGAPGNNGFRYKEQFGVIVVCKDEKEQRAVYESLCGKHKKVKVVRT